MFRSRIVLKKLQFLYYNFVKFPKYLYGYWGPTIIRNSRVDTLEIGLENIFQLGNEHK